VDFVGFVKLFSSFSFIPHIGREMRVYVRVPRRLEPPAFLEKLNLSFREC
jgi:hypothetical protein